MRPREGTTLLTRFTLLTAAAALMAIPQVGKPAGGDPDAPEIYKYRLTMDKIQKAAAATDAINKLLAGNPDLKKQMDNEDQNGQTIVQRAKLIDTKYPQVAAVIHSNGLTTREYVVVFQAFISDVMMVGMKKEGVIKEYPPNSVSPENAAFLEQNFDKLKDLTVKMAPPPNSR
jgi:hypothetical protein